ncbi:ATP-binding protein [Hyphomonas sp. FCG-A18]|uniref:sensor histidine kinase n=1 Tax=Hyphomonas sp. FCG-A18 TaxID=3080019 RepID=UPI002B2BEE72|nr:ATP-binding protein [Hyphomonas sp. FCG-A18]
MSQPSALEKLEQDYRRKRVRDYVRLTLGTLGLLAILYFTNAIGLVEAITGAIVVVSGTLALYTATTSTELQTSKAQADIETGSPHSDDNILMETIHQFITAMPFPALLVSPDQRIEVANAPAVAVFGLSAASGQLLPTILRNPSLRSAVGRTRETGSGEIVEFTLGGALETWLAHIRPGPEPASVFILLEDLTAVRRAEEARADFLANASHELRTPLTAIAGFIETMQGPAKDDKAAWDGFLTIMHNQAERMKRLIADLLSLSRIEFSEHTPPSTVIDMRMRTDRAVLGLQPIAKEADVTLALNFGPESADVIAEADEMTQVVQNLIGNAIKYSPKGGTVTITMDITATMSEAEAALTNRIEGARSAVLLRPRASSEVPAIWVRVTDHGPGVPAEHLARLGERFYRADESRGGKIEGTGLGLAIVKHIMTRHRGGLSVESLPNEETSFGVWLPLHIPDTPE